MAVVAPPAATTTIKLRHILFAILSLSIRLLCCVLSKISFFKEK